MTENSDQPLTSSSTNSGRSVAIVIFALAALLFVYHLFADRLTPYSSDGYVRAYLVEIAPEVSGLIAEVQIQDNQRVEEGDVLFTIDTIDYEIATAAAEAQLAQAGQSIGASTAGVAAAQAALTEARANFDNVQKQSARTLDLVERGIFPRAKGDEAFAARDAAKARVRQGEANLKQAQQALGPKGDDNPLVQSAIADLDRAKLNLLRTTVTAPSDGFVSGLQLAPGQSARSGRPVMAFIDIRDVWLVSFLSENNLGNVKVGDRVEIALDVEPGSIFPGKVESISIGRDVEGAGSNGLPVGLPGRTVTSDDVRFQVRIRFETESYPAGLRFGAKTSVIIYPTDSTIMNALGWVRIRLSSLWDYVD
ncbi:MAG: HlyD family secretion protein [Gammaproteobacteria bacterium]